MAIYEFERNPDEKIMADISEFKGRYLVDIRTFYQADGEWRPTKKGINVPIEKLPELENAIAKLKETAASLPLIEEPAE